MPWIVEWFDYGKYKDLDPIRKYDEAYTNNIKDAIDSVIRANNIDEEWIFEVYYVTYQYGKRMRY